MQTQTMTITVPFVQTGTPPDSTQQNPTTAMSLFIEFKSIIDKHKDERDDLSLALLLRGREFVVFTLEDIHQSLGAYLEGLILRILEIKVELRNPFAKYELSEPLLEPANGIIWERTMFEEYQRRLFAYSGENVEAFPHVFAKEMIDWLDRIPLERLKELSSTGVELSFHEFESKINDILNRSPLEKKPLPETWNIPLAVYEKMIEKVICMRRLQYANAAKFKITEILEKKYRDLEEEFVRFVQHVEEQDEVTNKTIDALTAEQKKTLETQETRLANLNEHLSEVELNAKQEAKVLKKSIYKVRERCKRDKKDFNDQIDDLDTEIGTLKTKGNEDSKKIDDLQAQAGHLTTQNQYLQMQVGALAHQVNNQDSGSCNLM